MQLVGLQGENHLDTMGIGTPPPKLLKTTIYLLFSMTPAPKFLTDYLQHFTVDSTQYKLSIGVKHDLEVIKF